jgi:hypothetical protein
VHRNGLSDVDGAALVQSARSLRQICANALWSVRRTAYAWVSWLAKLLSGFVIDIARVLTISREFTGVASDVGRNRYRCSLGLMPADDALTLVDLPEATAPDGLEAATLSWR